MNLEWGAASHTGQVRTNNQDSAVAEPGLFAVADGMGGHAAGEVASQVAIEALRSDAPTLGIVEAVRAANRAVIDRAGDDPALRGMGTTVCALSPIDGRVVLVNVGDSRGYLFRDGELSQITADHNLVAELERDGHISAEEARVHPQRNIITRVLGNDLDLEVDTFEVDPFRGDRFLLCSDGLFNEVDDEAIARLLRTERDPQRVADDLVRMANEAGGRDNITVVVVDVADDDDRSRTASAALAGAVATSTARPVRRVEPDTTEAHPASVDERALERRARRVTWRSTLFVLAVLLVLGVAVSAVWYVSRNTYFVGVDGDEIVIFRGKPGGVLWIDPTLEEGTGVDLGEIPAANRSAVEDGREYGDIDDARAYVERLHRRWQQQEERRSTLGTTTTTTSTPTTSTTTSPPAP